MMFCHYSSCPLLKIVKNGKVEYGNLEDKNDEVQEALPKHLTQAELNNLIHDLDLSKKAAQLLESLLKEKNLLVLRTKCVFYRH